LREAVPAKPSDPDIQEPPQHDDAAKIANANGQGEDVRKVEEQESGVSQDAAPLPSPLGSQVPGVDVTSGPAHPQAMQDGSTERTPGPSSGKDGPKARTAAAERSGTPPRSTLLDRLRGVAEETVEAEK
jgi:hypothetical protein